MVDMSGSGPGYKHTVIITPYMHILIHHIPYMLRRHGSLRIFSGQGIYFLSFPIWVLWGPYKKIQHSHGELQNFVSIKLGPKKEYVVQYDLKMLLTVIIIFIGVEKKNDDFRRYFHRKINRWDAAKNLLLVEKRQEGLRDCEREKRKYIKRKESFWLEGGKQEAAKKVVRISTTPQELPDTITHTHLHIISTVKNN